MLHYTRTYVAYSSVYAKPTNYNATTTSVNLPPVLASATPQILIVYANKKSPRKV